MAAKEENEDEAVAETVVVVRKSSRSRNTRATHSLTCGKGSKGQSARDEAGTREPRQQKGLVGE